MPTWWDRFGQEWARLGLNDDPTNAQAEAGFAFIGQAPPTVELFNSMFQWNDDKDNWLYGQIANVILADGVLPNPLDLEQLLNALNNRQKILLTGPTTFFVDAINGNDSTGTGEQNYPWRTIQHGLQWCLVNIEQASQWITLQLAPGTYEPCGIETSTNGYFVIQGDRLNPRAYLIKNPNGTCVYAQYGGKIICIGISVEAVGGDVDYESTGSGFFGGPAGIILFQDCAFGPCSNIHMHTNTGYVHVWGGGVNYTIYGGARCHTYAAHAGVVGNVRANVTIQNNPNFSVAFGVGTVAGCSNMWFATYSGTCQGVRGIVDANGIINLSGIDPNVALPGTLPAITSRGGVFA